MSSEAHAAFPPSSAELWLACPAWRKLNDDLPEDKAGPAAEIGTAAHTVASKALLGNLDAKATDALADEEAARLTKSGIACAASTLLAHAAPHVVKCRDYINAAQAAFGNERVNIVVEERVTIHGKECWGSCDCGIYAQDGDEAAIWMIDLKTGGRIVNATNNAQLLTYSVALWLKLGKPKKCRLSMFIHQQAQPNGFDEWSLDAEEGGKALAEHYKLVKKAIKAAKEPDAKPCPGGHCSTHYCKAQHCCPALHDEAANALTIADSKGISPTDISPAQQAQLLEAIPRIEKFFKAVKAHCMNNPPPGWKLVEGRSSRKWLDDLELIEETLTKNNILPAPFFERSPIGIPAAEKMLKEMKKPEVANLLFMKPAGKPTLVPESDPRDALDPLACLTTADEEQ